MKLLLTLALAIGFGFQATAQAADEPLYWIKVKASDKFERTKVIETGAVIEAIRDDYVVAVGTEAEVEALRKLGMLETSFMYPMAKKDFPQKDEKFHNYNEMLKAMQEIKAAGPDIVALESIGKSIEGRDLVNIRISTNLAQSSQKPGIVFIGTHHAREHLSTEIPLMLAAYLVREFKNGNKDVQALVNSREINIIPMLNPDGVEHDIATGNYQGWRKNRRKNANGTYGVDLNRNYSFKWSETGASGNPSSDTYYGTAPFSEPETQAVKNFIETKENLNIALSFHTFSELILYPWGWTYDSISDQKDKAAFEKMAQQMSTWNRYKPQPGSSLYLVSGEFTDWAYSQHKLFAFTFEMDPKFAFGIGGFYPGQDVIPGVFAKNLPAALYLIGLADNPYRVLTPQAELGLSTPFARNENKDFGLSTPLVQ
ncbi:MAG TPA: M14 family metallopeptidase [Bdellovibrionales bacterium]|nr:M14 family metallopeptidase [Bdellovibrionales bacterium]